MNNNQAYELLKIVLPEVIKKGSHDHSIQVAEDAVNIVKHSLELLNEIEPTTLKIAGGSQ